MTVFLYRQGNLETSGGKGRVSVLHPCLCVGGGGGWLVGSVLSLLMLSSRKPLTGSIHATSVAASRVEQALSEVASSLQSSTPKQGPLHPWMTLAQIWLHAGTLCPAVAPPRPLWAPGQRLQDPVGTASGAHNPQQEKSELWQSHQNVSAVVPPYPRRIYSGPPSGCLELWMVVSPLCTVFPFHTDLW